MFEAHSIREGMQVIGADGVHVGNVDGIEGDRIRLSKLNGLLGRHEGHHHYIPRSLIAELSADTLRLSANANVAVTFEEEADGSAR